MLSKLDILIIDTPRMLTLQCYLKLESSHNESFTSEFQRLVETVYIECAYIICKLSVYVQFWARPSYRIKTEAGNNNPSSWD